MDLDERLNRRDYIWDLDDEKAMKRLFHKKRGYVVTDEEKEKEKGKKKYGGKVIGEALISKDEVLLKKWEYDELVKKSNEGEIIDDDEVVVKKTKIIEYEKEIRFEKGRWIEYWG